MNFFTKGYLYPHILDSTGKCIHWLTTHFKEFTVEVTSQDDKRFSGALELAVRYIRHINEILFLIITNLTSRLSPYRFGKVLIIKDVDALDPVLYPILRNDYVVQGVRKLIRLGEKMVDWNENFRMFLLSRSVETQLPPQCRSLVNTINFNTTEAGLTEQVNDFVPLSSKSVE